MPEDKVSKVGDEMYAFAEKLFPITRSITGAGVRATLAEIQQFIPITVHEVSSGTKVFDWIVPKEWNIKDAYIKDPDGNKIIDFRKNNLHLVGYSVPVNKEVTLAELQEHLYSKPEQPNAIPFVTSYYSERWGFCLTQKQRDGLKEGIYQVCIDSELTEGSLTYGELVIPGETTQEVFLSTYICHPSMANNEVSGPVVTTFLAKWLLSAPRKYTYRIIFIPETIGSLVYLSQNIEIMKKNILAGFLLTCVGDDRSYSFMPSRYGNTLADKIALTTLRRLHPEFVSYSFLERGSDERQYCSPGVDLPIVSVMRTKYYEYPEYHTSLDDMSVITAKGLEGAYDVHKAMITHIEQKQCYKAVFLGEPQLGKRGLYPTLSLGGEVNKIMDFLAYADGTNDLYDISSIIKVTPEELRPVAEKLLEHGLVEIVKA